MEVWACSITNSCSFWFWTCSWRWNTNTIQYITIATTGNAQDFGDLTIAARLFKMVCQTNSWLFYIGYTPNPAIVNSLSILLPYASTGNSQDFGDAYEKSGARSTNASSSIRGVVAGGNNSIII